MSWSSISFISQCLHTSFLSLVVDAIPSVVEDKEVGEDNPSKRADSHLVLLVPVLQNCVPAGAKGLIA